MTYKPEEIIDLRSGVQTRAHDVFEETFMKFATEKSEVKVASETKVMPDGSLSDTETKGSIETNIDKDTADTNRIGLTPHPGMKGSPTEGMSRSTWGQAPEMETDTVVKGRRSDNETLSSSAEEISAQDSYDLLRENFAQMGSASKADKALISQNFKNGKPGEYNTRAQTLKELVSGFRK